MATYDDVAKKPYTEWNYRDVLIIMASAMSHNIFDYRTNIKVMATPYYPSVVLAIQWRTMEKDHLSGREFRDNVNILLKENVGLYYDWDHNRFMDSRGSYYRDKSQIDSLMFFITIENHAWGAAGSSVEVPVLSGRSIVPLVAPYAIYIPHINDLEYRIYLLNDEGKFIRPQYLWGRRKNILTTPESMFAMFYLKEGDHHFLKNSKKMYLLVTGFERDIKLPFDLSLLK
jgi:hypothetical protein